jgi:SAM-dependent methyltransferase
MRLNWIDTTTLSFNNLLLLERVQLSWFPGWVPEDALAIALKANPVVKWYMHHKCPDITDWLDKVTAHEINAASTEAVYQAEQEVLQSINDLLVYALDPEIYDTHEFLMWDSRELLDMVDFSGKTVLDIGAGTGRLAFTVAPFAHAVFAVEPVSNLRDYMKRKAHRLRLDNVYPVDGLLEDIPFPAGFADVSMGGFVFGTIPEVECDELERVTEVGGSVILCPGNVDKDTSAHEVLIKRGYSWSRFEAPGDGWKRKYWKIIK